MHAPPGPSLGTLLSFSPPSERGPRRESSLGSAVALPATRRVSWYALGAFERYGMKEWILAAIYGIAGYMLWLFGQSVLKLLREILEELQIIRHKVRAADYKEFDEQTTGLLLLRSQAVKDGQPKENIDKIDESLADAMWRANQK